MYFYPVRWAFRTFSWVGRHNLSCGICQLLMLAGRFIFPLPNPIRLMVYQSRSISFFTQCELSLLKKKWPLIQDCLHVLNMISLVSGLIYNCNLKPHCSSVDHLPSPISDEGTIVCLGLRSVCHGNWISSYISEQIVLSDPQNLMLPLIPGWARGACWLR